ncbi:MAG: hypothetical protein H6719_27905 [Sandaracinaceae bacterium]|nr:hypothetical protein [Sandaracinaceae bacterium]
MTRRLPCWGLALALFGGCGASEEPTEARAEAPRPRVFAEPEGAEAPPPAEEAAAPAVEEEPERARAIERAEAFVRAQGYTDEPPSVSGDDIVLEGIEGTVEDRHGMLSPRALSASGQGAIWMVTFGYASPEHAGRGRVLRLVDGSPPQFIHQDVLLGDGD